MTDTRLLDGLGRGIYAVSLREAKSDAWLEYLDETF